MAVPWPMPSKEGVGGRSKPASIVLPRRVAHGAHDSPGKPGASGRPGVGKPGSGARDRQTPGDSRPRKRDRISRRARRRSRGCARTLFVSLQKSTGGSGSEKPFSHTYSLERGMGDAVDGGLAYGCQNRSKSLRYSRRSALSYEALHCEATRGGGSRRRRMNRSPAGGVRNTTQGRSQVFARKGELGNPRRSSRRASPRGTGCAIVARKGGGRAAHLQSNEGAPDREKLRRLTTPGWNRSRRASPNRPNVHREKARAGIDGDRDRGVRGSVTFVRGFGRTRPHSAKAIR